MRYVLNQMVKALLYLKAKGILHRDIKLSNIFIGQDYQIKLADFGLSTYNDSCLRKGRQCGTPNFMSP